MTALRIAVLAAALLAALASPSGAAAQEPLDALADEVSTDGFPDAIVFELRAAPPVEIEQAELRYGARRLQCASGVSVGEADLTDAGGGAVSAKWEWNLRRTGALPPGAIISYNWRLTGGGRVFETPERTFVYEDPRFEWRRLSGDGADILWHEGDERFARSALDAAESSLRRIAESSGAAPNARVEIRLYEDAAALQGALVFPREYTGGVAYSAYGLIAIGLATDNLAWGRRAIAHELSHVVIGQAAFRCGAGIPSWLDEGLAMYTEGPLENAFRRPLDAAVAADRLFTLDGTAGAFPNDPGDAILAYAQSWSVVDHLIREHGPERMNALLQSFTESGSIEQAIGEAYGMESLELENRWRASLGLPARRERALPTPIPIPSAPLFQAATPQAQPAASAAPSSIAPSAAATMAATATAAPPAAPASIAPPPQPTATPSGGAGCNRSGGGATSGLDAALAALLAGGALLAIRRTA